LLFRTCSPWNIKLLQFDRPGDYRYWYDPDKIGGISGRHRKGLDINTLEMTYSIFNDIKPKRDSPLSCRFLSYFVRGFVDISSMCSIIETYKDFQSNNIEKIKKDKIRCGELEIYNANSYIRVYT
jgi:hypothetical protein